MSPLLLCSVSILMLTCTFTWAAQNFVTVTGCPKDANEWDMRSSNKKCQGDTPNYLCAAIENKLGRYGEICTKEMWIPENECVVLNEQTHNLDSLDCKADSGCPSNMYLSSKVWLWPVCFGDFYRSKRPSLRTSVSNMKKSMFSEPEAESSDLGLIIGVAMAILIGSLLVVFILDKRFNWGLMKKLTSFVRERQEDGTENHFHHSQERQDDDTAICLLHSQDTYIEPSSRLQIVDAHNAKDLPWKLAALQYYLVVILKDNSKMEELKDVTVLFKNSLFEHFGEALLRPLCNLNSSNDYQNMDISLVYNLLRNVCKHITPPTRGWGYEPSADDVSLGADIERIRSIWNRYCDGNAEFLYLKDIFVRMVDRYGNISDDVEFQDTSRKKIPIFKLNPECQEEDGIVLTKAIKAVVDILGRENCVVVKGTVGTGKSTCLEYIEMHYKKNQWEVIRKKGSIIQSDLFADGKRLLCCDDLFGMYNRGYFAKTAEIIEALENIEQKVNQELKVVLAIHDHVYEELQNSHLVKVLQNKRLVVDFNEISDAELLLIFNDQKKHGHCAKDPKCFFRNISFELIKDTLKENPGKLGDPILSLIYSNHHDIFAKKEVTQGIVKELWTKFQSMSEKTPDLFHILLYVMLVETHNLDTNVREWASELRGLDSKTVEQNVCHLDAFIVVHNDERRVQMRHELFCFALFKFCANHSRYMPLLLKHCQFQMIEEIIRTVSSPNQSEFCVILKKEMHTVLVSRNYRENLFERLLLHPLHEK